MNSVENFRVKSVPTSGIAAPVIMDRPYSAHTADFLKAKSTHGGLGAIRQLTYGQGKSKQGRKKVSLPGGKLQPLFKNNTAPAGNLRGSNHSILPNISSGSSSKIGGVKDLMGGKCDVLPTAQPSTVRVYLASHPTDTELERNDLMKKAVPKIQQFCAEHGLMFQLVDMHWGVNGKDQCTRNDQGFHHAEIEKCRQLSIGPNFVALIGSDYGNRLLPQTIESELLKKLELLANDLQLWSADLGLIGKYYFASEDEDALPPVYKLQIKEDSNDTELKELSEVLQAASKHLENSEDQDRLKTKSALHEDLNDGIFTTTDPRSHCLCYHREFTGLSQTGDDNVQELTKTCGQLLGINNYRPYYMKCESGEMPQKSSELYQKYLEKLVEDFSSDVIHLIQQGLMKQGKQQKFNVFSEKSITEEVASHTALARKKCANFVGQTNILKKVKDFLKDPKQCMKPFVVYGASGCGKSALLGHMSKSIRDWFAADCIIVNRVLGSTSDSSGIYQTVMSITLQILLAYGLPFPDVHQSFCTLYNTLKTFRDTIEKISREHAFVRPLFILLDGIDHLQPHDESLRALWAIEELPANIHVIISTVPNIGKVNLLTAMNTLVTKACEPVDKLTKDDVKSIVGAIAKSEGQNIRTDLIDSILKCYTEDMLPLSVVCMTKHVLNMGNKNRAEVSLPKDASDLLSIKLDHLEEKFGSNLVTMFASYVTCLSTGIQERELLDLLSMNKDVMEEVHQTYKSAPENVLQVPPGLISKIIFELRHFLEEHRAYGKIVMAFSNRLFYACVADKYQVIYPGIDEELINDDSTSFTLLLHEYMANMYLPGSKNSTLTESVGHVEDSVDIVSPQLLIPSNQTLLMRVPIHLKVLIPVEGVERLKNCVLFDFEWLKTKLQTVPVFYVMQDIIQAVFLTKHLQGQGVFEENDLHKDMEILFEFFQLAYPALTKKPSYLGVEILGRLSNLGEEYPIIKKLVNDVNESCGKEEHTALLKPIYPCFTEPGGECCHLLSGPTHVIDFLSAGSVAVMFSQQNGCDVWKVATGELLHRFPVNKEQSVRGVVPGHQKEFVMIGHYSHLNHIMDLSVWSSETGVHLIQTNFQYKFDVFVLTPDDDTMIFATNIETPSAKSQRVLLAVQVQTKEVKHTLPVNDVHSDGITDIKYFENIAGVSHGTVTVGDRLGKDLVMWDLDNEAIVSVIDLKCFPSIVALHQSQCIAVCASPEYHVIVVVDLANRKLKHTIQNAGFREMNDMILNKEGTYCLVATKKEKIGIYSLEDGGLMKSIGYENEGVCPVPSKLLLDPQEKFLLAGYETGEIYIYFMATGQMVHSLSGHEGRVNSLRIGIEGKLFSAADDCLPRVWNGEKIMKICLEKVKNYSPAEEIDPFGDTESAIELADISVQRKYPGTQEAVNCSLVNGNQIITGGNSIKLWSLHTGILEHEIDKGCEDGVVDLSLAYRGKLLVGNCKTSATNKCLLLRVWKRENGQVLSFTHGEESMDGVLVYCSIVLPQGDKILIIAPSQEEDSTGINLAVYDLFNMEMVTSLHCNIYGDMDCSNLRFLGFSTRKPAPPIPDELILPEDTTMLKIEKNMVVLPNRERQRQKQLEDLDSEIYDYLYTVLDYFPSAGTSYFFSFVISGESFEKINMDLYEPKHLDTLSPQCALLLDDVKCISGTVDGSVVEWDVTDQKITGYFLDKNIGNNAEKLKSKRRKVKSGPAHEGSISCLSTQEDNVASGSQDGTVKVWKLKDRTLLRTFSTHSQMVTALSMTPEFVVCGSSNTVALASMKSSTVLSTFYSHNCVASLIMSGHHIVVITEENERKTMKVLQAINVTDKK